MSRIPQRDLNEPLYKWCDKLTRYYKDNPSLDVRFMITQLVYMSFRAGALDVLSKFESLKEDYE